MTVSEQIEQRHQEDLQRLRGFRLLDDDFLTKCFEGSTECIQLVLQIVLEIPDLEIVDVRTQVFVENLLKRSVRLDVLATDSAGKKINVEIQRADRGAGRKRARYNSSMMDANLLQKGEDFDALPETYVVFITAHDVIGEGQPLYQIERYITSSGKKFDDGSHILYVNGEYRAETPLGKLMHDFSCTNPADMYYDVLAERVKFFKESREGISIMCKVMEDMRNASLQEGIQIGRQEGLQEGLQEGRQEGLQEGKRETMLVTARKMLDLGKYALDEIAQIAGLPLDEVKKLQPNKKIYNLLVIVLVSYFFKSFGRYEKRL